MTINIGDCFKIINKKHNNISYFYFIAIKNDNIIYFTGRNKIMEVRSAALIAWENTTFESHEKIEYINIDNFIQEFKDEYYKTEKSAIKKLFLGWL